MIQKEIGIIIAITNDSKANINIFERSLFMSFTLFAIFEILINLI